MENPLAIHQSELLAARGLEVNTDYHAASSAYLEGVRAAEQQGLIVDELIARRGLARAGRLAGYAPDTNNDEASRQLATQVRDNYHLLGLLADRILPVTMPDRNMTARHLLSLIIDQEDQGDEGSRTFENLQGIRERTEEIRKMFTPKPPRGPRWLQWIYSYAGPGLYFERRSLEKLSIFNPLERI